MCDILKTKNKLSYFISKVTFYNEYMHVDILTHYIHAVVMYTCYNFTNN